MEVSEVPIIREDFSSSDRRSLLNWPRGATIRPPSLSNGRPSLLFLAIAHQRCSL